MTVLLNQLVHDWGYDTPEELVEDFIFDGVMPGICTTPSCGYSTEVEPDQDRGWCECCNANTVQAATVLMGVI